MASAVGCDPRLSEGNFPQVAAITRLQCSVGQDGPKGYCTWMEGRKCSRHPARVFNDVDELARALEAAGCTSTPLLLFQVKSPRWRRVVTKARLLRTSAEVLQPIWCNAQAASVQALDRRPAELGLARCKAPYSQHSGMGTAACRSACAQAYAGLSAQHPELAPVLTDSAASLLHPCQSPNIAITFVRLLQTQTRVRSSQPAAAGTPVACCITLVSLLQHSTAPLCRQPTKAVLVQLLPAPWAPSATVLAAAGTCAGGTPCPTCSASIWEQLEALLPPRACPAAVAVGSTSGPAPNSPASEPALNDSLMLSGVPDVVTLCDMDGSVLHQNAASLRYMGCRMPAPMAAGTASAAGQGQLSAGRPPAGQVGEHLLASHMALASSARASSEPPSAGHGPRFNLLSSIFRHEPQKLADLLVAVRQLQEQEEAQQEHLQEEAAGEGAGLKRDASFEEQQQQLAQLVWQGIVRVPACLAQPGADRARMGLALAAFGSGSAGTPQAPRPPPPQRAATASGMRMPTPMTPIQRAHSLAHAAFSPSPAFSASPYATGPAAVVLNSPPRVRSRPALATAMAAAGASPVATAMGMQQEEPPASASAGRGHRTPQHQVQALQGGSSHHNGSNHSPQLDSPGTPGIWSLGHRPAAAMSGLGSVHHHLASWDAPSPAQASPAAAAAASGACACMQHSVPLDIAAGGASQRHRLSVHNALACSTFAALMTPHSLVSCSNVLEGADACIGVGVHGGGSSAAGCTWPAAAVGGCTYDSSVFGISAADLNATPTAVRSTLNGASREAPLCSLEPADDVIASSPTDGLLLQPQAAAAAGSAAAVPAQSGPRPGQARLVNVLIDPPKARVDAAGQSPYSGTRGTPARVRITPPDASPLRQSTSGLPVSPSGSVDAGDALNSARASGGSNGKSTSSSPRAPRSKSTASASARATFACASLREETEYQDEDQDQADQDEATRDHAQVGDQDQDQDQECGGRDVVDVVLESFPAAPRTSYPNRAGVHAAEAHVPASASASAPMACRRAPTRAALAGHVLGGSQFAAHSCPLVHSNTVQNIRACSLLGDDTAAAAGSSYGGTATGCAYAPPDSVTWHDVRVSRLSRAGNGGRDVLLVVQTDVSARITVERSLAAMLEAEHQLLEGIFPSHVLQHAVAAAAAAKAGDSNCPSPSGTSRCGMATGSRHHLPGPASGMLPRLHEAGHLATVHPQVTVLFADVVGFTSMCAQVAPEGVMAFLNSMFSRFDELLDIYGVYKVETIGDCYMVAGGLMRRGAVGSIEVRANDVDSLHATKVVSFARAMLREASHLSMPNGQPLRLRVGVHSGPVTSGVVGTRMPRFCLFGDTVNTASRMESTGVPGCIHASAATRELVDDEPWEYVGGIEVKGKGLMDTYMLNPRLGSGNGNSLLPQADSVPAAARALASGAHAHHGGGHHHHHHHGHAGPEALALNRSSRLLRCTTAPASDSQAGDRRPCSCLLPHVHGQAQGNLHAFAPPPIRQLELLSLERSAPGDAPPAARLQHVQ